MKLNGSLRAAVPLFAAGLLAMMSALRGSAQTGQDEIAVIRASIKADRTATVADAMQLTEEEGKVFWPLYREYWAAMDKHNDGLVKLVLEYGDSYPNLPEERARQMLKDYLALEAQRLDLRAVYLKKMAKVITSVKALRLAQVENRLDLAVRLQLANAIPLAPAPSK